MDGKNKTIFTPPTHRHKRKDMDASDFKRRQLRAIEKRKRLKQLLLATLSCIALVMVVAVIAAYLLD